jgi:leukotriene-A4 hydrolase
VPCLRVRRRRRRRPAGNLVTNATWEHFWLNEGFTVYLERKILGRLYGEKVGPAVGLSACE